MAIRMIRALALVAALGPVGALGAQAQSSKDRALSLLVDELRVAGYTQISVMSRLMGGYVIEAQKETVAVVIAVDATDHSVTYSELLTEPSGGFFATPRRPPGGGLNGVLANYAQRLASSAGAAISLRPEPWPDPTHQTPALQPFSSLRPSMQAATPP